MNFKKFAKGFIFIILSLVIAYFLTSIKRRRTKNLSGDEIASGKNLIYRVFNSENKISLEIKCQSSRKDFDESRPEQYRDRMYLNKIKGKIFKKGKLTGDTEFSSESGYVENNFLNLYLKGDAKVESDVLLISSDYLFMEGNSLISSKSAVEYWLKDLDGVAKRGIEYHIKIDVLNLFKTSGSFVKNSRKYDFNSKKLIILGNSDVIVFRGRSIVEGPGSKLKGREISMQFTEDFKKIKSSVISGNGYVYISGEKKGEFREAFGRKIRATFSENGNIESLEIRGNGIINLKKGRDRIRVESNLIFIKFNPKNSNVSYIRTLRGSKLDVTGKDPFSINANRIKVEYDESGNIKSCSAMTNCLFKFRDYKGSSKIMDYNAKTGIISISGKRSIIEKKGSRFVSTDFTLDSKNNKLFSEKEIVSTVKIKSENPVFSSKTIFLSSKKVEINEKKGEVVYSGNVKLLQEETELTCNTFRLPEDGSVVSSGNINLKFNNNGEIVKAGGGIMTFSDSGKKLTIDKGAFFNIQDGSIKARTLKIGFNKENKISELKGTGKTEFTRSNLTGRSDEVAWDILKKKVSFSGNAKISKEKSGETSGEIMDYYIEKERIVVISKKKSRTKTKIK